MPAANLKERPQLVENQGVSTFRLAPPTASITEH
jgi:hypothetical protein